MLTLHRSMHTFLSYLNSSCRKKTEARMRNLLKPNSSFNLVTYYCDLLRDQDVSEFRHGLSARI